MNLQVSKKIIMTLASIGFVILLYSFLSAYQNARLPSNVSEYSRKGSFKIDSETILDALDRGETNVFMSILATPGSDDQLLSPGSVPWTQSDYLKISRAMFQLVWQESLEWWIIQDLTFDRECQDNPIGFDIGNLTLYKVKGFEYSVREITIYPLAGVVDWGDAITYLPPLTSLSRWKNIDLARMNITADDALRIAEEHGGKEARLSDNNDCRIYISIPGSKNDYRWKVSYYFTPSLDLFIDPFSGKYEILK